jgi:hypothetical protein
MRTYHWFLVRMAWPKYTPKLLILLNSNLFISCEEMVRRLGNPRLAEIGPKSANLAA